MQVKLFDMNAKEVGELTLNDQLFDVEYNEPVIHQAIVTRLANNRQGTKSTLTRSEVRGGVRRAPAERDRVLSVLRSGFTAAWCSLRSPEISPKR